MTFKEYLFQKIIPTYFMLVTFLVIFMWIAGSILYPDAQVGYDLLKSPLIYAGIGVIPEILCYSKKEHTIHQTIINKLVNLCILIVLILGFSYIVGVIKSWIVAVVILCGILIIDGILELILWRIELHTSQLLTHALTRLNDEK